MPGLIQVHSHTGHDREEEKIDKQSAHDKQLSALTARLRAASGPSFLSSNNNNNNNNQHHNGPFQPNVPSLLSVEGHSHLRGDNGSSAYIPLHYARQQLKLMAEQMMAMKQRHTQTIGILNEKYQLCQQQERDGYTQIIQQIAQKAKIYIQQQQNKIQQLQQQIQTEGGQPGQILSSSLSSLSLSSPSPSLLSLVGTSSSSPSVDESELKALSQIYKQHVADYKAQHSVHTAQQQYYKWKIGGETEEENQRQYQELPLMLDEHKDFITKKEQLSTSVNQLKQQQQSLQQEKKRLMTWKDDLASKKSQQQSNDDNNGKPEEEEKTMEPPNNNPAGITTTDTDFEDETAFNAAKQQLSIAGATLKADHAAYEQAVSAYRQQEEWLQLLFRQYNIGEQNINNNNGNNSANENVSTEKNSSNTPDVKRRLSPEEEEALRAYISWFFTKSDAKAKIKELADEINEKNERLKAQRAAEKQGQYQQPASVSRVTSVSTQSSTASEIASSTTDQIETQPILSTIRQLSNSKQQPTVVSNTSMTVDTNLSAQLTAARNNLERQTEIHETSMKEIKTALEATQQELKQKQQHIQQMRQQLQRQLEEGIPSSSSVISSPASSSNNDAALSLLGTEKNELTIRVSSLLNEQQQYQQQISTLQQQLSQTAADTEKQYQEMTQEATTRHQQQIQEYQIQQQQEKEEYDQQIKSWMKEKQQLTSTVNLLEQQLQSIRQQYNDTQLSLSQSQARYDQLQLDSAAAFSAQTELKQQISDRDGIINDQWSKINEHTNTISSLTTAKEAMWQRYLEEQKRRKEFQFKYEDAKGKIRVYARVRPFTKAEIERQELTLLRCGKNDWTLELNETQRDYLGNISDKWREFQFDHVFQFGLGGSSGNGSQLEVFEETSMFAELSCQGINTCIFAYGQSGTGKTWTMAGESPCADNNYTKDNVGLKPRMIERIFEIAQQSQLTHEMNISCYMVEIYLNTLEDIFWKYDTQQQYFALSQGEREKRVKPEPPELKIRTDGNVKKKVLIDNVRMKSFTSAAEMLSYCEGAEKLRRTRRTGLNEASSRSHLVFALLIENTDKHTGKKLRGKLSLVDLAGSERADKTNVDGLSRAQRDAMMEEGVAINESLRMLKNVFRILGSAHLPLAKGDKPEIVQYRGNKLTELMQDSLGGAAKTLMFVNVGPAASNISESIDSLQYGDYVKNITNEKATADEDLSEQVRRMREIISAYKEKHGDI